MNRCVKLSDEYNTRQSLLMKIRERYDDTAWEDFVNTYKNYIYKIIINLNIEKHDADDLLQTVLLKMWKRLPDFDYNPGKGKFRYFIGRVTKNYVFKFLNSKKRRTEVMDNNSDQFDDDALDPEINKIVDTEWRMFISEKAWDNISPNFSEMVLNVFLMHAEDKTFQDIAEDLDIEVSAAYVYRHRVQKALLKEIARLEYEIG